MSTLTDLSGKVALVTGGGTGIGLIIAKGLATNGAKVYISGRRADVLAETAKISISGSGSLHPLTLDVTDKTSITNAVKVLEESDGKLNILVNNAGIIGKVYRKEWPSDESEISPEVIADWVKGFYDTYDFEDWNKMCQTNVTSIFFVTLGFLSLLVKGTVEDKATSSVINISSIWGHSKLNYGVYPYSVLKKATTQITLNFATDFSLKKIPVRVNAISPGSFPSEMTAPAEVLNAMIKESRNGTLIPIPAGRVGKEEEMSALAVYLASGASEYMNGQDITLDGGVNLVNP